MIPEKFKNSNKSFVAKLEQSGKGGAMSAFSAFPDNVNFEGKDKDENVVLMVRKSIASYIPQILVIIVLLIAPIFVFTILGRLDAPNQISFALSLGLSLMLLLGAITFAIDTFVKWFYSVYIITDQRILDVDFVSVLSHRISEAQLENVEDVSHDVSGFLSAFFDYGSVFIQTAAAKSEFEFLSVPKPREIQDVLLDLLELKQGGKI